MFKGLVRTQPGERYYPSFEVAKIVGLSSKVVSRLTSSVIAANDDRSGKVNLGLNVKFEAKARKVIDYSRRTDRYWEFSQKTVALLKEYKVTGPNTSPTGFLTHFLCRKNSLRSQTTSRRVDTVNSHSLHALYGCFKFAGLRFLQVIRGVPRYDL
jgi:hypothetical protein